MLDAREAGGGLAGVAVLAEVEDRIGGAFMVRAQERWGARVAVGRGEVDGWGDVVEDVQVVVAVDGLRRGSVGSERVEWCLEADGGMPGVVFVAHGVGARAGRLSGV